MDPALGLIVVVVGAFFFVIRTGGRVLRSNAPFVGNDETAGEERITVKGMCAGVSLVQGPSIVLEGEVATGDAEFDRQFRPGGPEDLVRAIFDVETRRKMLSIAAHPLIASEDRLSLGALFVPLRLTDIALQDGRLSAQLPALAEESRSARRLLRALGESLRRPGDVGRRLADALQAEPEPAVRRLQFSVLTRDYPDHPATIMAVRQLMGDEDPAIRLTAATAAGPNGRTVLLALAGDEGVADAVAAAAVEALGARLAVAEAAAILAAAVESASRRTPLHAFGRGATGRACVATLALSGHADAQQPLIDALECSDATIRVEAARALGRVGTAAAVAPLRAAAGQDGAESRRAMHQAVAEIQARVHGTPGEVSLTSSDSGTLALADDRCGEISLSSPSVKRPD